MKIKTIEEVEERLNKIADRYPLTLFGKSPIDYTFTAIYKIPFELKDKTVKSFIENFLNYYNRVHITKYKKRQVCSANRRRSLGDIYRITKNYFPEAKLKEVLEAILSLKDRLGSFNCPDIDKQIYYSTINRVGASNNLDSYKTDELGIEISKIFKDFDTENKRFSQFANDGRKVFEEGKKVNIKGKKYHLCSARWRGHWKDPDALKEHNLQLERDEQERTERFENQYSTTWEIIGDPNNE